MTAKKDKILRAALELFAEDGFTGTSTSKVAIRAGVSEGLIFRHFKNKEGLLEALLLEGEMKAREAFANVVMEPDPKEVIRKTIHIQDLMLSSKDDFDFWKLQYKIKWEIEVYGEQKMEPLEMALSHAFKKLGYENPQEEARLLLVTIDGLATRLFLQSNFQVEPMINLLHKKYQV